MCRRVPPQPGTIPYRPPWSPPAHLPAQGKSRQSQHPSPSETRRPGGLTDLSAGGRAQAPADGRGVVIAAMIIGGGAPRRRTDPPPPSHPFSSMGNPDGTPMWNRAQLRTSSPLPSFPSWRRGLSLVILGGQGVEGTGCSRPQGEHEKHRPYTLRPPFRFCAAKTLTHSRSPPQYVLRLRLRLPLRLRLRLRLPLPLQPPGIGPGTPRFRDRMLYH